MFGQIYDDELYHWKYIKKVKKNGKWRYYYDKEQLKDDLGFDEKEAYEQALANQAYTENKVDMTRQNYLNAFNRSLDFKYVPDPFKNPKLEKMYGYMADKNMERYRRAGEANTRAKKAVEATFAKYERTPIGQVDKMVKDAKRIAEKVIDAVKYDFLYEFEFK